MLGVHVVCRALGTIGFIHAVNIAGEELDLTAQVCLLNSARSDGAINLNHLCITSRVASDVQTQRYKK
jgi:hypothetical protein